MTQKIGRREQQPETVVAIKGIHHVGVTVSDIEGSEEWYGRVLGLRRQFVEDHHGSSTGGYAVVLGNDNGTFNLGLDHHPDNDGTAFVPSRNGLDHLCLNVGDRQDMELWVERLDDEKVEHSGIFDIPGMPLSVLNCKDLDGIAIELISIG